MTLISRPVHRTDLLLGLVQFSNQITSEAMLFNVTSESFEPLILLYCVMKYILRDLAVFVTGRFTLFKIDLAACE